MSAGQGGAGRREPIGLALRGGRHRLDPEVRRVGEDASGQAPAFLEVASSGTTKDVPTNTEVDLRALSQRRFIDTVHWPTAAYRAEGSLAALSSRSRLLDRVLDLLPGAFEALTGLLDDLAGPLDDAGLIAELLLDGVLGARLEVLAALLDRLPGCLDGLAGVLATVAFATAPAFSLIAPTVPAAGGWPSGLVSPHPAARAATTAREAEPMNRRLVLRMMKGPLIRVRWNPAEAGWNGVRSVNAETSPA